MKQQDFEQATRFLDALVADVQRYGVSSSAMQSTLAEVAHALNLQGQFLATPTQVQSIIWDEDENRQRLHVSVSNSGDYDLAKLALITELVDDVKSGAVSPGAGLDRLRAIRRTSPEYGPTVNALAFALCGLGFGVILGISWLDVLLAGALSVVSFGIVGLASHSQGLTTALELVVAAVAAVLATLLTLLVPGTNALAVAVCASIYFVPGFGLTLGASEMMSGNTLSGLIGFTRATVTSAKLAIGALVGSAIVRSLVDVPPANVGSGVSHIWTWLFAPLLVLGLAILFRVRRKDLIWPVLGSIVVWLGVQSGSEFGIWQGTFIGTFLLISVSRVFARISKRPETTILLPAVMVLVPGVAALRALYDWDTQGLVEGLKSLSDVAVLIGAILGGVVVGDAVWSVKQAAVSNITSRRARKEAGHQ